VNLSQISHRDIRFSTATAQDVSEGLDALLGTIRAFLRRYVVVTPHQANAVALWTAHTHTIDAFDCTPYLQITSATKRAGKTRLLEVLEPLVLRPWLTGRTSAAALVRKVDAECPTLLLDESDAAFGGEKEYAEALRGQLNTGYRRSGKSTVCIGQGAKIEARDFSTFSPKAIAGIGKLPDTVGDRSITIELRRRTADEPCERWRERDGHHEAAPIRKRLATWAAPAVEILRASRPDMPLGLGDRQMDVWEPLIAIADVAGGKWPGHARAAAVALTASIEDTDITIELLRDISEILQGLDGGCSSISTRELVEKLTAEDDRPWATWRRSDKPITARGLARLLGQVGIHPDRHLRVARGYRVDAFSDAIARYLPSQVSQRHKTSGEGPESPIAMRHEAPAGDRSETGEGRTNAAVVTHGRIETGERGPDNVCGGAEPWCPPGLGGINGKF
jgi:hypothetical protein